MSRRLLEYIEKNRSYATLSTAEQETRDILVCHLRTRYNNKNRDVKTVVSIENGTSREDSYFTFQTFVMSLPNSFFSHGLVFALNHIYNDKFLALSEREPGVIDIYFVSYLPFDYIVGPFGRGIYPKVLDYEISGHSSTCTIVQEILSDCGNSRYHNQVSNPSEIMQLAFDFTNKKRDMLDSLNLEPLEILYESEQ